MIMLSEPNTNAGAGCFYAKSTETLGMTPTKFRKGGAGECIQFAVGESSLGSILVAASDKGDRWGIERKRALLNREGVAQ